MISVVIPIYNTEQSLAACIDSVLDSTYEDFEVVLVNDGSTDNSLAICREYCGKDDRVRLIDQENQGVSEARNRAVSDSKGDWVVFVDSDDRISRDFLKIVAEEDAADLLIFDFIRPDWKKSKEHINKKDMGRQISYYKEERRTLIDKLLEGAQLTEDGSTNMRSPCGKAYRRSVVQRNAIKFSPDIFMGEDILFNVEFLLMAQSCKYISVPVYIYTVRPGSVTHSFVSGLLKNYFIFQKELKDMLVKHDVFSELENAYYANALENMAYILIKEVFSPYNDKKYGEKCELCKKIGKNSIYAQALKYNHRTGIWPRRILLGFFRLKCYGIVSLICGLSYFCIEQIDKRQEKQEMDSHDKRTCQED